MPYTDPAALTAANDRLAHYAVRVVLGLDDRSPAYDDALQDARLRMWVAAKAYRPERGRFSDLAFTAMKRQLWRHAEVACRHGFKRVGDSARVRKKAALPLSLDVEDGDDAFHESVPGKAGDPATEAELADEVHGLWWAVLRLPDTERDAVLLRFRYGMSYPAMGLVLGFSRQAAAAAVGRGLVMLRESFGVGSGAGAGA